MPSLIKYLTTSLLCVCCLLVNTSCRSDSSKISYADFIKNIQANWKGCAISTPVGPRPYDIHFVKAASGHVNGMADPGPVSNHHWSYQLEGDVLWLRFLSTFRGNDQPIWLSAIDQDKNTIIFRSKRVRKLRVEVSLIGKEHKIEIYLHEKPHVSIRLFKSTDRDNRKSVCENIITRVPIRGLEYEYSRHQASRLNMVNK